MRHCGGLKWLSEEPWEFFNMALQKYDGAGNIFVKSFPDDLQPLGLPAVCGCVCVF